MEILHKSRELRVLVRPELGAFFWDKKGNKYSSFTNLDNDWQIYLVDDMEALELKKFLVTQLWSERHKYLWLTLG